MAFREKKSNQLSLFLEEFLKVTSQWTMAPVDSNQYW